MANVSVQLIIPDFIILLLKCTNVAGNLNKSYEKKYYYKSPVCLTCDAYDKCTSCNST